MASTINGKTINQLIQIEDITGNEIIPLSVKDEETDKYVTRSITLNNMLKLIVNAIQNTNNRLSQAENDLNDKIVTTVSELNDSLNSKIDETNTKISEDIESLKIQDDKINEQLAYTNTYVSDISSKVDDATSHIADMSYNYNVLSYGISELTSYTSYLSSYTNAAFAQNDITDSQQQEEISANSQLNSYQEHSIEILSNLHSNPWEIAE